jgi:hypothetical protein
MTETIIGIVQQSDHSPAAAGEISSFALSGDTTLEIGADAVTPVMTATYSNVVFEATLSDDQGSLDKDVTSSPEAFSSDETFTKVVNGASVTFTLSAIVGASVDSAQVSLVWLPRVYWGVGGASLTEAQVKALSNSSLQSSHVTTFSANAAGVADYIWYCFPQSFDASDQAAFTTLAISGGFLKHSVVSVTNTNGVTQDYACWRSANPQVGNLTVAVS